MMPKLKKNRDQLEEEYEELQVILGQRMIQIMSFIKEQKGMFSFSGLNPMQVDRLRNEFSIYIVGSGRINVAGITPTNIDRLCDSIATVL